MSRRVASISGLSFLDLLCCGMGGVMMLFMILVAVKGRVEFGPKRPPTTPGVQLKSPFAVVLVATGPAPLFDPKVVPKQGPFHARRDPAESRGAPPPSWGARHAMCLADRPPDALSVGPLAPGAEADVQIFHRGRRLRSGRLSSLGPGVDAQGFLTLWPLPEDAMEDSR